MDKSDSKPGKPGSKSTRRRKPKSARSRTRLLALEPRILFDASLALDIGQKVVDTSATADDSPDSADNLPALPAAVESTADKSAVSATADKSAMADTSIKDPLLARISGLVDADRPVSDVVAQRPYAATEVVFIDSTLWNAEALAEAARANVEVHMLQPGEDGVRQISEVLADKEGITAVHIVSHGSPGTLYLGASELNAANLPSYAAELEGWRSHLAAGADILIYGCSAAAGEQGAQFAQQLGDLTGADIGASTDETGGTADANWSMEFVWGTVNTGVYGDATALANYNSALATVDLTGNTNWTPLLYGSKQDPGGDQQASAASTDVIGNATHATLYYSYDDGGSPSDESNDVMSFRFRVAGANSQGGFGAVGLIGVDANADGRMDLFLGIDDRQGQAYITLYDPGSGANISPNTTSITPASIGPVATTAATYRFVAVSSGSDSNWDGNTDIDGGGKTDYFVSYKVNFALIKSELQTSGGIAITNATPLRFVLMTMTQTNSINGDIGGIVGGNSSSLTFDQLGAFSPFVSAADSPPIITSGGGGATASYSVAEDANSGIPVTQLAATDMDPGDIVKWQIVGGADQALFSINATTGQLSFIAGKTAAAPVDANGDGRYEVTVKAVDYASDGTTLKGGYDTQDITVSVIGSNDTTRPTLDLDSGIYPADGATGIAPNANFRMTFSENIQAGTGYLYIRNASTGAIVQTIPVTDTDQVRFVGNTVTVNPLNDLAANTGYYIEIQPGAFKDMAGNGFVAIDGGVQQLVGTDPAGVNDTDPGPSYKWNFTTGSNSLNDSTYPTLTSATVSSNAGGSVALDNQTNVAPGTNIVLNFSETVYADNGFITIRNSSTGATVAQIAVSDTSQVSFSGSTITINPTVTLDVNTAYNVQVGAQAVQDAAGNHYAGVTEVAQGVTNAYALNFTTGADTTAPTVTQVSASNLDGTWIKDDTVYVRVKFSETVTVSTTGGTPTLQLETGATDRLASYYSGSGTDTLVFSYQVQSQDTSADLNYLSTSALALNGGTIRDAAGNNATLTLPALASADSLAGQKNLVIDAAPTNTVPGTQSAYAGTPLVFGSNQIQISDVDSSLSSAYTVTLTATNGTVTLGSLSGLTFSAGDGTADSTVTFTGSFTNVNNALNNLAFTGTAAGAGTLRIVSSDGLTSVNGQLLQDDDTFNITVNAPVAPVLGNGGATLAYTENGAAAAINGSITVTDPDSANLGGGYLKVSFTANGASSDQLSVLNQGTAAGQIGLSGNTVSYGGVAIGTINVSATGVNGADLRIDLNSSATPVAVQALARAVAYANSSDAPGSSTRTVSFTVQDGDGHNSSQSNSIAVTEVNDAPVLSGTLTFSASEDAGAPVNNVTTGTLVSTLTTGNVTDPDGASVAKGIAVTATNQASGTWYYSTDNGTTWTTVGVVSGANSLLLRSTDRLYFAPSANFNGTAASAITVLAWDTTTGTAGQKVSTGTTGGTTAFSTDSRTIDVAVSAVNDAPVASGSATLTADAEDTVAASVNTATVTSLFAGNFSDSADAVSGGSSANTLAGVAITGYTVDGAKGAWKYSTDNGSSWQTLAAVTNANSAFTLKNTDMLRFEPVANFNGAAPALTATLIDSSTGISSWNASVDASSRGNATAFSSATVTLSHSVTAVNDAPVMGDISTFTATINAAQPSGATGTLVSNLMPAGSTDPDGAAPTGVALSGAVGTNGTWWYSKLGDGSDWTQVGSVSDTNALLLSGSARLYFQPTTDYSGSSTGALTVRAWDQSDESVRPAGTKVDVSTNGGTTAYSSTADTIDLSVTGPNRAPVLTATGGLTLSASEEAAAPSGTGVGTLVSSFTGGVSDADGNPLGIAITSLDTTKGTWWYSTNGGSGWTQITSAPSVTSALLLNADANTKLYFRPTTTDFNGSIASAVTFRAWDRVTGTNGGTANISTDTNNSFSSNSDTITVSVTGVNDAPVDSNTGAGAISMTAVAEDSTGSSGDTVSTLFGSRFGDTKDNQTASGGTSANTLAGVAITAYTRDAAKGEWQYYNGSAWANLGSVASEAGSVTVASADKLRFVPAANFNGPAPALTVRMIDSSRTVVSGATVDLSASDAKGGSTAFSLDTITLNQTVTAANDAPTRTGSSVTLAAINEDASSILGATVNSLFSTMLSDTTDTVSGGSSANSYAGILIVGNAASSAQGTWEYSTTGGSVWLSVGTSLSTSNALALSNSTNNKLRFTPALDYNGTPGGLTVRLIDDSAGTVTNGTVTSPTLGGSSQYSDSFNDVALNTTVNAVGDAPTGTSKTLSFKGTQTAQALSRDAFGYADADGDSFNAVSVVATATGLKLSGVAVTAGQTITIASIDAGNLTYDVPANNTNRSFTFQVRDSSSTWSTAGPYTATLNAVNTPAPIVSVLNNTTFTEGGSAATIDSALVVTDTGGGSKTNGAQVIIVDYSQDTLATLAWNTAYAATNSLTASYSSGTLTVTSGNKAPGIYQTFLRSVTYSTTSDDPDRGGTDTTREIRFQVKDTSGSYGNSVTALVSITAVNDSPTRGVADSLTTATLSSSLEDSAAGSKESVQNLFSANFFDKDYNANNAANNKGVFTGIAITAYTRDAAKGEWLYSSDGTSWTTINGTYSASTALYLKTSDYLRFVPAANYSGDSTATPSLTVKLADNTATPATGASVDTTAGTAGQRTYSTNTITLGHSVTAVNDAPTLSATTVNTSYAEGAAAVTLFSGASVTAGSGESDTISNVVLTVDGLADGSNEKLTIGSTEIDLANGSGSATVSGVSGTVSYSVSVSGTRATVTLSKSGMTTAEAQTTVNSLKYRDTSSSPTAGDGRTFTLASIQDSGGTANGGVDTAAVNLRSTITLSNTNSAPTLGAGGNSFSYTENDAATVINGSITVADTDSASLSSATITITNYQSGDVLSFTPTVNTGNIAVSTNSAGQLVLISPDGTATKAQFQAALQAVKYSSTSDDPNTTARTVTFKVNDGSLDSGTVSTTINVTRANDAPLLADRNLTLTVAEDAAAPSGAGAGAAVSAYTGGVSDVDSADTLPGIAVTGVNNTNGTWWYYNGSTWSTIGSRSDTNALLLSSTARVYFQPNANVNGTISSALTFRAWDRNQGSANSSYDIVANGGTGGTKAFSAATDVIDVVVTSVNDAPTGSAGSLSSVSEDVSSPAGAAVSALFSLTDTADNQTSLGGSSAGTLTAIAITGNAATAGQGTWQYSTDSGASWTAVATTGLSDTNAVVLNTSALLRFVPSADWNGTPGSLTVRVSDGTGLSAASYGTGKDLGTINATSGWSNATVALGTSITAVNDAPTRGASDNLATATLTAIGEDTANPGGGTVSSLFGANFYDGKDAVSGGSSANTFAGVAIVDYARDAAKGEWQYKTVSGAWTTIGASVALDSAILLKDTDSLRFVPAANFNGSAPVLGVRLIESGGSAYASGDTANLSGAAATGGSTVYSANGITLSHSVTAANDAPTVTGAGYVTLAADAEDSTAGQVNARTVSALFGGSFSDSADDQTAYGGSSSNTFLGVAITAYTADAAKGTWQYSSDGSTWNTISSVGSAGSAFALKSTDQLRFVPATNFNGDAPVLTTALIDSSAGAVNWNSTSNDLSTRGGTTAFSSATVELRHAVTGVNDAPTRGAADTLTTTTLAAINEDNTSSAGATVTSLFGANFSDAIDDKAASGGTSPNTLAGIAIVGYTRDAAKGEWQYYNGSSWTTIGDSIASDADAVTVAAADKLRFVPATNYNGAAPSLSVRLIDSSFTSVTTGATYDVSSHGGSTAFSDGTVTLSHTVNAVNDAPVGTDNTLWVAKNGSRLLTTADFGFTDPNDSPANTLQAVQITQLPDGTKGTLLYDTNGSGNWVAQNATFTVSASDVAAGRLKFEAAANKTGLGLTNFLFRVQDNGGGASDTDTSDRSMLFNVGSQTPPVLSGGSLFVYEETGAAVFVNQNLSVYDADNTTLESATVTMSRGFTSGEDQLSFVAGGAYGNITSSWDSANGVLTLTSSGGTATLAQWEAALQSVKYVNLNDAPSTVTRVVSFAVNDGTSDSNVVQSTMTLAPVNDAPDVAGSSGTLTYNENDAATVIDAGVTVSDPDAPSSFNGGYLQVTITANSASEDQLSVLASTSGTNRIQVSGSNVQFSSDSGSSWTTIGTVDSTLNGQNGAALRVNLNSNSSPTAVQLLAQRMAYANTSDAPSTATRSVSFTINDGGNVGSGGVLSDTSTSRDIAVVALNDAPQGTDGSMTIERSSSYTLTAADFGFSDPLDSPSNSFAGVVISTPATGLKLNGVQVNANDFVSAADIAANKLVYTAPGTAGAQSFGFKVRDDGASGSGNVNTDQSENTISVTVTAGPVPVLGAASDLAYSENQVATAINPSLTLTDTNLSAYITQATVSITSGFLYDTPNGKGDILSFTTQGTISGSYNTATGVLTLTSSNASATTLTQWRDALRSVTYSNTSDDLSNTSKTVTISVTDDLSQSSIPARSTVTVTALNDAPVLSAASPALTSINEDAVTNGGQTVASFMGTITDADGTGVPKGIAITGTSVGSGSGTWQYSLDGTTWSSISASSGSALLLQPQNYVRFVPDGQNAASASLTYRAWDQTTGTAGGTANVGVIGTGGTKAFSTQENTASITVTAVNDAPGLSGNLSLSAFGVGRSVTQLLTDSSVSFDDVDSGSSMSGIAVVSNSANAVTQGTWQYSTDGTNWYSIGAVSDGNTALALSSSSQIRFAGVNGYNGTPPSLDIRALDNTYSGSFTSGATRALVDTTTNGGTTAIAGTSRAIGAIPDTTPPSAPGVSLASDTGGSGTDKITNVGTLSLTGVESGATVQYSLNGTTWSTAAPSYAQGSNTVYVRQVDLSGNTGAATTFTFSYDTQVTAPGVELASDTGASGSDKITNAGTLTVTGTESGAVVQYSADGTVWATSAPSLTQGTNTVLVRQVDLAGNTSGATTFTFSYDTQVTAPGVELASDTGASGSDKITNAGTLTVTGTESGAVVQYSADGTVWATSAPSLTQGTNTVLVRQVDLAGNTSGATTFTFSYDTQAAIVLDAPIMIDDVVNAAEKGSVAISGRVNGIEAGRTLVLSISDGLHPAVGGSAIVGANGTWSVANLDLGGLSDGPLTVRVSGTDLAGNAASASTSIVLDTTPPALTLSLDAVTADNKLSVAEAAGAVTITGSAGGAAADGDVVRLKVDGTTYTGTVSGGRFAIDVPGSRLVLDADRTIEATLNKSDSAGNAGSATASRTYGVQGNTLVANNDNISVAEDASVTVSAASLLANDTSSGSASIVGVGQAAHGTVVDNGDGTFTYKPAADFNGQDSFTYQLSDNQGGTATGLVNVVVTGVNDAPVVNNAGGSAAIEDGASVSVDALGGARDVDGDVLAVVNVPASLPVGVSYDAVNRRFTLDPGVAGYQDLAEGMVRQVVVNYGVSDGNVVTPASVVFNVTGVNDAPVVSGPVSVAAVEDGAVVRADALANAGDVDRDALQVVNVPGSLPAGVSYDAGTRSFVLDPSVAAYQGLKAGEVRTVAVSYGVSDGRATTPASVNFVITGANDAPVAADGEVGLTTTGSTAVRFDPVAQGWFADPDGDALTITANAAGHGSIIVNDDGSLSYVAVSGYSGTDTFTVSARDPSGATATRTVTVTVQPATDQVTVLPQTVTTDSPPTTTTTGTGGTGGTVTNPAPVSGTLSQISTTGTGGGGGTVGTGGGAGTIKVGSVTDGIGLPPTQTTTSTGTPPATTAPTAPAPAPATFEQINALPAPAAGATVPEVNRGFAVARLDGADGGVGAIVSSSGPSKGDDRLFVFQGVQNTESATPNMLDVRIPTEAFAHTDVTAVIQLEATLADDSKLPDWISFNKISGELKGVPPTPAAADIEIKIVARDNAGRTAELVFQPLITMTDSTVVATSGAATAPGSAATQSSGSSVGSGGSGGAGATVGTGTAGTAGGGATSTGGTSLGADAGTAGTVAGSSSAPAQSGGSAIEKVDRGFPVARIATSDAPSVGAGAGTEAGRTGDRLFVYQGVQNTESATPRVLDLQLPMETFAHTNPSAVVKLEATLADGSRLPTWIKFDPQSGTLQGVPPSEAEANIEIKITARDEVGRVAEVVFHPVINFVEAPPAGGGSNTAGTPATQPPADSRDAAATDAKIISGGLSGQPAAGGEPPAKAVGPGADAGSVLKISPSVAQATGFPVARVESEGVSPAAVREDARLFVYQGMTDLSFTGRGSISFSVPLDAFAHSDPTAIVELQARLADGSALPGWLNFNSETGSFTGSPAGAFGHYDIIIIARDRDGRIAQLQFSLDLQPPKGEEAPPAPVAQADVAAPVPTWHDPAAEKDADEKDAVAQADVDDAGQAKAHSERIKNGALTFTEQAKAVKLARDPILAKILSAKPAATSPASGGGTRIPT